MLPDGLRDAEPQDREALIELWVAAWRLTLPAIDFDARREWLRHHLDDSRDAGARILVIDGAAHHPVAFAIVDLRRCSLDQLAVDPAHQGLGLASLLIACAKALSPSGLELVVNRDNPRASQLYARHGFRAVATGYNPSSGLPTVVMQWNGGPKD